MGEGQEGSLIRCESLVDIIALHFVHISPGLQDCGFYPWMAEVLYILEDVIRMEQKVLQLTKIFV